MIANYFYMMLEGLHQSENSYNVGRATFGRNSELQLGELHAKYAVQRGIWVPVEGPKKHTENPDRFIPGP
jgi:hypothetical protein